MSSIEATDDDTTRFLRVLERICAEQEKICVLLDELILLMRMPSESILEVLAGLLRPMGHTMTDLAVDLKEQLGEEGQ